MAVPLKGHPGVGIIDIPKRAYQCPRCIAKHGDDWWWHINRGAVPLEDGHTIVCSRCATEAERRNRWCETCHTVKDQDEFDLIRAWHWKLSCRACLTSERPEMACAQCGTSFTPKRSDARFCSGACRVANHRARHERLASGHVAGDELTDYLRGRGQLP